jgi:hypothetical protein
MTTTTNLITIYSIMIGISLALTMFQSAVLEVNSGGTNVIDVSSAPHTAFFQNNDLVVGDELLPPVLQSESETGFFTDVWNALRNTFKVGGKLFVDIFSQPYRFLKDVGVPVQIYGGLAVLWYLLAIILMISWWAGR